LATPALGVTPTWATPYVDFDLDADFDLDFVNARVWDGTSSRHENKNKKVLDRKIKNKIVLDKKIKV